MNRIVITDCDHHTIDIERAIFARAGYEFELAQCHTANEVIAAGTAAVALLTQYAPITEAVLAALPSVRVLGVYGASLDNVDLPAVARRGLRVVNVPDYGVDEVADAHYRPDRRPDPRHRRARPRGPRGAWDFRAGGELRRSSGLQIGIIGLGRMVSRSRVGRSDPLPGRGLRFTSAAVKGVRWLS